MTRIEVPNTAGRRRSGRAGRWFMILLLLIVVGCGLWTWLTLAWAYAEGERAGVLQKFVRRGWVCKTNEGEIALYYGGGQYLGPGTSPQLWDFSVRDKSVAQQLAKAVGHRVELHYTEHPGIPTSCFADTRYFVDKVTIADTETGAGPALPAQPAPATSAPTPPPANSGSAAPTPTQPQPQPQPPPATR
ncbi:MAG TPA: hypothetical protein VK652_02895 [Steroidobacteraceae bacterium]|nr:hypothetical protein [Steroidobacteraceae bacterium]